MKNAIRPNWTDEPKKTHTLRGTLRPLLFLSTIFGVLPVWCDTLKRNRCRTCLNWSSCLLVFVGLASFTVFECVQLYVQFSIRPGLQSIIPNLMWLLPFLVSAALQFKYTISASLLMAFLDDWHQLEKNLHTGKENDRSRFVCGAIYLSILVIDVISFVSLGFDVTASRGDIKFLSYYPELNGSFTFPLAVFFQMAVVFWAKMVRRMFLLIPTYFYYHASLAVRSLNKRIETSGAFISNVKRPSIDYFEKRMHSVWSDYMDVSKCIDRANGLFGLAMTLTNFFEFLSLCMLVYYSLYELSKLDLSSGVIYATNFLVITYQLALVVLVSSCLPRSCKELRDGLSELFHSQRILMSVRERETVNALLEYLDRNRLAASPWNLYTVKPSLLLFMSNLLVTYVAILVQSN